MHTQRYQLVELTFKILSLKYSVELNELASCHFALIMKVMTENASKNYTVSYVEKLSVLD